jgi:hypothetical protein
MKRRHYPQLVNAYVLADSESIYHSCSSGITIENGGVIWVPSRAEGFCSIISALKLAWGVFRGRYDALVWPHQGDTT